MGLRSALTDANSVLTARVEMVDGLPVVTWEPKLSAGEEARRNTRSMARPTWPTRRGTRPLTRQAGFSRLVSRCGRAARRTKVRRTDTGGGWVA